VGTICSPAWFQLAAGSTRYKGSMMGAVIGIACVLAWFTHIFTCFAEGLWGFLIAGALLFPIGILHGFFLWFR
jgi:hypothetical protein